MDTVVQERFRMMTFNYLKNAKIIIIVYGITYKRIFEKLNDWIQDVKEVLDKEEVIIGITSNNYDLYESQEVIKEKGVQLTKENKCLLYETKKRIMKVLKMLLKDKH